MDLQAKEGQRFLADHPKLESSKEVSLPCRSQREHSPAVILIADFQLPELSDNKFLLF